MTPPPIPAGAAAPSPAGAAAPIPALTRRGGPRAVHPIEAQSMRILRSRIDTSHLGYWSRTLAERVIHASADLAYLTDLVLDEAALAAGAAALAAGVPIVADTTMVAAGVSSAEVIALIGTDQTRQLAVELGSTRAAAAMRLAAHRSVQGRSGWLATPLPHWRRSSTWQSRSLQPW